MVVVIAPAMPAGMLACAGLGPNAAAGSVAMVARGANARRARNLRNRHLK
ncbi:MAG TPA: hypothetical protein VH143_24665 [Kofleriaceae bacterium]|nr:hypothetical protein [Kofleriaceae bacterium]